jgi:hypothetical protein
VGLVGRLIVVVLVVEWVGIKGLVGNGLRSWMMVFRVLEDSCQEGFERMKFEFGEVEALVEKEERWIDSVKLTFPPLQIQWSLDVNEKIKIGLLQPPKSDTLSDQPRSSLSARKHF